MKNIFTIHPSAADWIIQKLGDAPKLSVTLNKKGCAGGEYEFKPLADGTDTTAQDSVKDQNVTIYFPRTLTLKLISAQLILHTDGFNTRLDFQNPNEKSRCGCGESVGF